MQHANKYLVLSLCLLLAAPAALPQAKKLSTRDVTQVIAQYAAKAQQKPSIQKKTAQARPAQPPTQAKTEPTRPPRPQQQPQENRVGDPGPGGANVHLADFEQQEPLVLRYTMHRQIEGGETEEVTPETVFRSGERFRLKIDANQDGYLYVVNKSPNGKWTLLFPTKNIAGGNNRVEADYYYPIPPEDPATGEAHWFEFDEETGEETLYLVLARKPVPELDALIYGQPRPAGTTPRVEPAEPVTLAQNLGSDFGYQFENVREAIYRERGIFNTADGKNASATPDSDAKAVYVVDLQNDPDSRLVVELKLKHE